MSPEAAAEARSQGFNVRETLGDDVSLERGGRAKGLFRVKLESGRVLVTHGPDPKPARASAHAAMGPGSPERAPVCATSRAQHILYGVPEGAEDRYGEVVPQLRSIVRRMNAFLNEGSLESGGPEADLRARCDDDGEIKVSRFVGPPSGSDDFDSVVSAARAAGFDDASTKYSVFYDSPHPPRYCGVGSIWPDDRLSASNANNQGRMYALSHRDCWEEGTPLHELGHNMGAVQAGAPNSTGTGWHCNDEYDVMCYSPDGGDRNQSGTVTRCADREHFDCDHDDYFDSAPEPGEWLSEHWNLGSRLNRFLDFADIGEPANDPFTAAQALSGAEVTRTSDTNRRATKEPDEPDHAEQSGGASVWYRWRAPADGAVTVDTAGSDFDTTLAAYTGSSLGGLSETASNDDVGQRDVSSRVGFRATAGRTYRIAVDGYNGEEGAVKLRLKQVADTQPLRLTLSRTGARYPHVYDLIKFYGTVSPPKPRVSIVIYLKGSDGVYRRRTSLSADASTGRFSRDYRPSRRGLYRVRVYLAGDGTDPATWSRALYMRVP